MTALYDGLRLTKYWKFTMIGISYSKLLRYWYYIDILTISNKYTWLWWTDEYVTVLAWIYIYTCIRV